MSKFSDLAIKQLNEKPLDKYLTDKNFDGHISIKPVGWQSPKMVKDFSETFIFGILN